MALKPLTYEDPLYQLLRDGNIKEFNKQKPQGGKCDLASCDFRHLDLRGLDAAGLDFSSAYIRVSDLRGIDFPKLVLQAPASTAQESRAPFSR